MLFTSRFDLYEFTKFEQESERERKKNTTQTYSDARQRWTIFFKIVHSTMEHVYFICRIFCLFNRSKCINYNHGFVPNNIRVDEQQCGSSQCEKIIYKTTKISLITIKYQVWADVCSIAVILKAVTNLMYAINVIWSSSSYLNYLHFINQKGLPQYGIVWRLSRSSNHLNVLSILRTESL